MIVSEILKDKLIKAYDGETIINGSRSIKVADILNQYQYYICYEDGRKIMETRNTDTAVAFLLNEMTLVQFLNTDHGYEELTAKYGNGKEIDLWHNNDERYTWKVVSVKPADKYHITGIVTIRR